MIKKIMLLGCLISMQAHAETARVSLDCSQPPTERTDGTPLEQSEIAAYQALYREAGAQWAYAGTSPTNSCGMEILIEVAPGIIEIAMITMDTEGRVSAPSSPVEIVIGPVSDAPPEPPVGISAISVQIDINIIQ